MNEEKILYVDDRIKTLTESIIAEKKYANSHLDEMTAVEINSHMANLWKYRLELYAMRFLSISIETEEF